MSIEYTCWYEWWVWEEAEYEVRAVSAQPDVPALTGMSAFVNGFWIDKEGELTVGYESCRYWIPSSRIVRVDRELRE